LILLAGSEPAPLAPIRRLGWPLSVVLSRPPSLLLTQMLLVVEVVLLVLLVVRLRVMLVMLVVVVMVVLVVRVVLQRLLFAVYTAHVVMMRESKLSAVVPHTCTSQLSHC